MQVPEAGSGVVQSVEWRPNPLFGFDCLGASDYNPGLAALRRGGYERDNLLINPFDDRPQQTTIKAAAINGSLIAVNIAGWLWAWITFSGRPMLIGTAVLAYMFGLRHAFDADHIAAIDNVVRKLMQEQKRPIAAGFFFSLGHSTIVVIASLAIAATAATMQGRLAGLHRSGEVIGTAVSTLFLLSIGVANLVVLKSTWALFSSVRSGRHIAERGDDLLALGGFYARVFRRVFRLVSHSWQMYPIGFLFGLGFDTATEIGLLGIAATQAAQGMSIWSILVFPALFTAGMSLIDTADSTLMVGAYGWAFLNPVRKLWYNLTITAASVAVALLIGGVEGLGLIADRFGLDGRFWTLVDALDGNLTNLGFVMVGIFIASWAISTIVYYARRYDDLPAGEP